MTDDQREIQRKLRVLPHANRIGGVSKTCRYFGIAPSCFYRWRAAYREHGPHGLRPADYPVNSQALLLSPYRPRYRCCIPLGSLETAEHLACEVQPDRRV